jgi:hypothetical protein
VAGLDRRFLAIAALTLLLASISLIFTAGYFFFGWGGQYRYELFYFPSPVIYTLDSLTATGRMLSFALPVLAFLTILLTAEMIRIPSPTMLSTEPRYQNGDLPGPSKLKQYPAGILATSVGKELGLAPRPSFASDFLGRLFPYDSDQNAVHAGRTDAHLSMGAEMTTMTTVAHKVPSRY